MSIKLKLRITFLFFMIITLTIVGVNYFTYVLLDSDAAFVNYSGSLRAANFRMAQLSDEVVFNNDLQKKDMLKERIEYFEITLNGLIEGDSSKGLKKADNEEIISMLNSIHSRWEKEFKPAYEAILSSQELNSAHYLNANVADYVNEINELVVKYSSLSSNKVKTAKLLSIGFLIAAIISCISSILFIQKGVIKPIELITKDLNDIADGKGDLTKQISVRSKDEIGTLTTYFNKFISDVRSIVSTISVTSNNLNESVESIASTSDEIAKSTEMIAHSVTEVSHASEEQSIMVENLNDLVERMDIKIQEVMKEAENLLSCSDNTKISAQEGNITINEEVSKLRHLVSNTKEVTTSVNELESYSNEIKNILSIIESISSQTNLLALNASIEAARAGEAGRGFTVVSEEIRKLSEETTLSTVKIGDIVKNIVNKTVIVKTRIDEMIDNIQNNAQSIEKIQTKLDEILEKSNETYEEAEKIKNNNTDIKESFKTINESAGNISHFVEVNSQNTQEVAAAVEEQTASFQEVSASMSFMSELSQELKNVVERFKV